MERGVGLRALAYDGFPTLGFAYHNGRKVQNARITTHLGSGGASFGPAAAIISQAANQPEIIEKNPFYKRILLFADSRRLSSGVK